VKCSLISKYQWAGVKRKKRKQKQKQRQESRKLTKVKSWFPYLRGNVWKKITLFGLCKIYTNAVNRYILNVLNIIIGKHVYTYIFVNFKNVPCFLKGYNLLTERIMKGYNLLTEHVLKGYNLLTERVLKGYNFLTERVLKGYNLLTERVLCMPTLDKLFSLGPALWKSTSRWLTYLNVYFKWMA
jgi:hypothetical protein